MVKRSFLLNLLQFVALVAPALAILMQVVLSIEDDRNLNVGSFSIDELRILQLSLVIVLAGGGLIGGQLIASIDNVFVVIGMVLIFGGLPFSALAVFLMANKATHSSDVGSESLQEQMRGNFINALSIMLVVGVPAITYFGMYEYMGEWVDSLFSFGFFYTSPLKPSMLLGAGFMTMVGVSMLTVFKYELENLGRAFNLGVRNALYLPVLTLVFVSVPYVVAYFILNQLIVYLPIRDSNAWLNIPHIWTGVVYYVLFTHDYDPFQED